MSKHYLTGSLLLVSLLSFFAPVEALLHGAMILTGIGGMALIFATGVTVEGLFGKAVERLTGHRPATLARKISRF